MEIDTRTIFGLVSISIVPAQASTRVRAASSPCRNGSACRTRQPAAGRETQLIADERALIEQTLIEH